MLAMIWNVESYETAWLSRILVCIIVVCRGDAFSVGVMLSHLST